MQKVVTVKKLKLHKSSVSGVCGVCAHFFLVAAVVVCSALYIALAPFRLVLYSHVPQKRNRDTEKKDKKRREWIEMNEMEKNERKQQFLSDSRIANSRSKEMRCCCFCFRFSFFLSAAFVFDGNSSMVYRVVGRFFAASFDDVDISNDTTATTKRKYSARRQLEKAINSTFHFSNFAFRGGTSSSTGWQKRGRGERWRNRLMKFQAIYLWVSGIYTLSKLRCSI